MATLTESSLLLFIEDGENLKDAKSCPVSAIGPIVVPPTTSLSAASGGTLAVPDGTVVGECVEVSVAGGNYQTPGSAAELTGQFSGDYRVRDTGRTTLLAGAHGSTFLRPLESWKAVWDGTVWQVTTQFSNKRFGNTFRENNDGFYTVHADIAGGTNINRWWSRPLPFAVANPNELHVVATDTYFAPAEAVGDTMDAGARRVIDHNQAANTPTDIVFGYRDVTSTGTTTIGKFTYHIDNAIRA